uniref:DUF659 domain-containing protein n=1 Tax=Heterorhabditis bacteriophora TaxID=37862 RepID=A0A1I7WA68_HETBA
MIGKINKKVKVPSRREICGSLLENSYAESKNSIIADMKDQAISLNTDMWTNKSGKISLLAISAHFVNKEWCRWNIIIAAKHFVRRHTGEEMTARIEKTLEEMSVTDIVGLTTDSAASMKKTARLLKIEQSVVSKHLIKSVKKFVSKIHQSTLWREAFGTWAFIYFPLVLEVFETNLNYTSLRSENKKEVTIPMDVCNGWNSTYLMLLKLNELVC